MICLTVEFSVEEVLKALLYSKDMSKADITPTSKCSISNSYNPLSTLAPNLP